MFVRSMRSALLGLTLVAAAATTAQAGVADIPGTDNVQGLVGANNRGDLLWFPIGNGLRLSTKDAAGVYTHTAIDATVAGKGWAYSNLAANGDAVWMGLEPGNVMNIYFWDASTRSARALTLGTGNRLFTPAIGGNGNAAWPNFVPQCNGCADGAYHVNYFDKATGLVTRLTAAPKADVTIAMNLRGDAYWMERASDNALELRRYDAVARTVSVVTRRPAGSGSRALRVNDFGDAVWAELAPGTSLVDVHLYDQRSASVLRITSTAAEETDLRINAVGDLAWRAGPELWTHNRRTGQATLVSNRNSYNGDLSFNELGEVAWTRTTGDFVREMHYWKRATGVDVRVRPTQTYPVEVQPALTGAGELFYVSTLTPDGLTRRIVRATREFSGN